MEEVGPVPGMLDRDRADIPAAVEIKLRVLVEVPGFGDVANLELDVKGVCFPKYSFSLLSTSWNFRFFVCMYSQTSSQ
jgi:hypothetical protein